MAMPNDAIQLKGNLQACEAGGSLEDVSAYVSMFTITSEREGVAIPGTLTTGRRSTAAGLRSDTLKITFHSGVKAAQFWAMLYEVIGTDSSELEFSGTFDTGAVSADNPQYDGTAVLLTLDSGGEVGALRQQTIELPVTAAGLTVTTV